MTTEMLIDTLEPLAQTRGWTHQTGLVHKAGQSQAKAQTKGVLPLNRRLSAQVDALLRVHEEVPRPQELESYQPAGASGAEDMPEQRRVDL